MIAAILNMSFTASVMIIIIAIFRRCFIHKMPKKTFLVLWGVVILRLLIPFTIPSNFSAYMLFPSIEDVSAIQENTNLAANPEGFTQFVINTSKTAQNILSNEAFYVSPILIIWMLGLMVCAFFFLFTHLKFRVEYNTSLPAENLFICEWGKKLNTFRKIQVRETDKIFAPLTYGILKPIILLPKNLDYSDTNKMQYILMHEFTHIKRFDTLTKWLLAAALCVHWFNPLVWMMYNFANRDIELSCDESVVRTFGELRKSDYAITLISMEEKISSITQADDRGT